MKSDLSLDDVPLTYNMIEAILRKLDAGELFSEISKDGAGQDFWGQLQNGNGTISLDELIRWAFTESRGSAILEKFESMFSRVEVLEHYNNSYKIKVSRDSFSIGYLFGLMEDVKTDF